MDYQIGVPTGAKYDPERGMKIYLMPDGRLQVRKKAPWHGRGTCVGVIYSVNDLRNGLFMHLWSEGEHLPDISELRTRKKA